MYSEPVATLAEIVGLPTFDNVLGNLPLVCIDPLNMAGPPEGLQATNMGWGESLGVLAVSLKPFADALQMPR